jgi:hypothetical protein
VSQVEQELCTLPGHTSPHPVFPSFLCSILSTIVCPFVFILLATKPPAFTITARRLEKPVIKPNSHQYKLTVIVFDIPGHRLFNPVDIKKGETDKRSSLSYRSPTNVLMPFT